MCKVIEFKFSEDVAYLTFVISIPPPPSSVFLNFILYVPASVNLYDHGCSRPNFVAVVIWLGHKIMILHRRAISVGIFDVYRAYRNLVLPLANNCGASQLYWLVRLLVSIVRMLYIQIVYMLVLWSGLVGRVWELRVMLRTWGTFLRGIRWYKDFSWPVQFIAKKKR